MFKYLKKLFGICDNKEIINNKLNIIKEQEEIYKYMKRVYMNELADAHAVISEVTPKLKRVNKILHELEIRKKEIMKGRL